MSTRGVHIPEIPQEGFIPCYDVSSYVPDTSRPYLIRPRIIKLVYHIMNSSDSSQNFSEESGPGFLWLMEQDAIRYLKENEKMNLPENNQTPVYPANISYLRVDGEKYNNGFYFHYDDELYYFINKGLHRNNHRQDVIRKYNVGGDSILNVFVMPHHPDSISSATYAAHASGIALGNHIKVSGIFENKGQPWMYASLLNHEVGHVLGLRHSWISNDGCADTPVHANCFENTGIPPCDGIISNNFMDYNNSQKAMTPCQLGIMHRTMSDRSARQRAFLVKNWCDHDTSFVIRITGEEDWRGSLDLIHSIVIEEGAILTVHCRVAMAEGSKISVLPGGTLILKGAHIHNDCGQSWEGIELMSKGKKAGVVLFDEKSKIENVRSNIAVH